jgi:hypothetical protein
MTSIERKLKKDNKNLYKSFFEEFEEKFKLLN